MLVLCGAANTIDRTALAVAKPSVRRALNLSVAETYRSPTGGVAQQTGRARLPVRGHGFIAQGAGSHDKALPLHPAEAQARQFLWRV